MTPATKKKREAEAANATLQVTGAVGWRKDGLRYKKNEVFLDVIETVSMLMSTQASTDGLQRGRGAGRKRRGQARGWAGVEGAARRASS